MIIRPKYPDMITPYIDTPFVKILLGVRRAGKSTIMKMIADELRQRGVSENRIIFYNFDALEHEDIKTAKLLFDKIKGRLTSEDKIYLFFDEIQEVKDWGKLVNSLMTDFNTDIYVTGSNSRMLSSEISTYLTGRYIQFRIFPLSFAEYLEFRKNYSQRLINTDGKILHVHQGKNEGIKTMHIADFLLSGEY